MAQEWNNKYEYWLFKVLIKIPDRVPLMRTLGQQSEAVFVSVLPLLS